MSALVMGRPAATRHRLFERVLGSLRVGAAACALALAASPAQAQDVIGTTTGIQGAGSTFAFPVISAWSREYRVARGGIGSFTAPSSGLDDAAVTSALDYEPVGSLAGMLRVRQKAVDFAASDVPLTSDELARLGLGQFPIVIGGVAIVVNLEGVGAQPLRLTGPLLADVFLGRITNWSDPSLKALNPGLALPDAEIAVVRRSDGSGTTFNFTHYLSKASAGWREKVGSDLSVDWPTGSGAKGNTGVSQAVKQTRHSIGYVEYSVALKDKLAMATLQNAAGRFVAPGPESFQAAAATADWAAAGDFHLLLSDAPGDAAYPVVATVYALMPVAAASGRTVAALDFFRWSLDHGSKAAGQLGYVPLPASLVAQVKTYWALRFKTSGS